MSRRKLTTPTFIRFYRSALAYLQFSLINDVSVSVSPRNVSIIRFFSVPPEPVMELQGVTDFIAGKPFTLACNVPRTRPNIEVQWRGVNGSKLTGTCEGASSICSESNTCQFVAGSRDQPNTTCTCDVTWRKDLQGSGQTAELVTPSPTLFVAAKCK